MLEFSHVELRTYPLEKGRTIACGNCHYWDLHFLKREKYVNDEDFIVIKCPN
jgi:hypothetical protein